MPMNLICMFLVHSLRIPAPLFSVANLMSISRFVRGKTPGLNTGFDIDEADLFEMQQCQRTVVASAIFGNYFMYFSFIYNCTSFVPVFWLMWFHL
jgi:hypothetical protein